MDNSKKESVLFSNALAFASKKHAGQVRKNGSPYIYHPIKVSEYVASKGYDIRYQIVAIFHDLLEDTDATIEELSAYCDEEMLLAIKLLTKTEDYNPENYISDILDNELARVVKNADRINNLNDSTTCGDKAFIKRYIKDTEDHYKGRFSKELDDTLSNLISSQIL